MFTDYGKKAYLKVLELEKRVDKIDKELSSNTHSSLLFDLATPEMLAKYNKSVNFCAINDCVSKIDINIKCSVESEITYKIYIDSNVIKSGSFTGGKDSFSIEAPLQKGTAKLSFEFDSEVHFSFSVLSISVSGLVKYLNVDRRLSCIEYSGKNYITYLNEGVLNFYSYKNSP